MTPNCWFASSSASISSLRGGGGFSLDLLEQRPAMIVFRGEGPNAQALFANESGGHRWQRVPPTERNGRIHTSTTTVAVMQGGTQKKFFLARKEVRKVFCRSKE